VYVCEKERREGERERDREREREMMPVFFDRQWYPSYLGG
jgi:hypothetical protein